MYYSNAYIQERGGKLRGFIRYRDETGKWRSKSKTLTATGKREGRNELAQWRADMEREHDEQTRHAPGEGGSATVGEYVSAYVDGLERGQSVECSTLKGYRATLKYIRAAFDSVTLADLEPKQVQRWEIGLTESGLSSSTVGKAHRLLKQALTHAVNMGDIYANPLASVKPPKRGNKTPGINALDAKGYRATLETLRGLSQTPTTVAAQIALYTGLREGETCGLQWGDLNPESGALHVTRSIGNGTGGTYVKKPKTDRARTIYLPRPALEALASWRNRQAATWALFGCTGPSQHDYILGTPDGKYLSPETLSREWRALAKALNIIGTAGRRCTFHDLRHTWATLYIAAGGDAVTAANNLGHASPSMTLNIYSAQDPNAQRTAALLIERVIEQAGTPEGTGASE